ncbi:MAG TPA: GntR family transcriptional regulator [Terriglobales bacterium]|nr:GntR family transcriptional regulator [Terriglobales bacterium]
MRLWLSHVSEISVREQLGTQIVLAILSDDLKPGARLPSTRELARRFRVHANTVSAAYRDLERAGWVELRRGSGVYVGENRSNTELPPALALDHLIADLFRSARKLSLPLRVVQTRLQQWLELQPPDHFLLIEPDPRLSDIVLAEIRGAVTLPVRVCDPNECENPDSLSGAIPLVLPSKAERVRKLLPPGVECLRLRLRSVTDSLAPWMPARNDALITIASRWPEFLTRARTMLVAAGFDPNALLICDAQEAGWQKRLSATAAVVCDVMLAGELPKSCRAFPFRLVSDSSLMELKEYEKLITAALD